MSAITRKVIDSNRLRSEELREYLAKSKTNFAIITDYASMEAYSGDTLITIYKSMAVLAEQPEQVIILKDTSTVCGLKARGHGLQQRLINQSETEYFPTFCRHLKAAQDGDANFQRQLLKYGDDAKFQLERVRRDAARLGESITGLAETFSAEELKILRTGKIYSDEMIKKLMEGVLHIAAPAINTHPKVRKWPSSSDLPNLFIFRVSLCVYLLVLDWISYGGIQDAPPEKLRNDIVDMNFVAFGTYFDGLLSNETKVKRIHALARVLLAYVFGCHIHGVRQ